jgi:hypothetical protein
MLFQWDSHNNSNLKLFLWWRWIHFGFDAEKKASWVRQKQMLAERFTLQIYFELEIYCYSTEHNVKWCTATTQLIHWLKRNKWEGTVGNKWFIQGRSPGG